MSDDGGGPLEKVRFGPLLSITGSVASLVALAIVLVDKIAQSRDADPQAAVWQITLAIAALIALGVTATVTYYHVLRITASRTIDIPRKALRLFGIVLLSLMLMAVFADGLFAAVYWRWWLGSVVRTARAVLVTAQTTNPPPKGPGGAIARETVSRLPVGDRSISVGTEVTARLTGSENESVEGFNVAAWLLRGRCRSMLSSELFGQCTIELRSRDFDPYLIVSGLSVFVEDDDSGGGRNARVNVRVTALDALHIIVTSATPGETGAYTLRVRSEP